VSEAIARGTWVVVLTLTAAVFLTILPLPAAGEELRPQWVAMTLIFWALALPDRVGVLWAFGTGLVLDVATGTLLGHHALGLSIVVYVAVELHARIRIFPLWQQSLFVWLLLVLERLLALWILGATGQPLPSLTYWASTFVGLLLWPWLAIVLRDLARRTGAV
jgi:rod shape-determining protein MreD